MVVPQHVGEAVVGLVGRHVVGVLRQREGETESADDLKPLGGESQISLSSYRVLRGGSIVREFAVAVVQLAAAKHGLAGVDLEAVHRVASRCQQTAASPSDSDHLYVQGNRFEKAGLAD